MRRSITPDREYSGSQKRRKIVNDKSTYIDDDVTGVAGKIKKMVLQNFMCHKNLEFNFGDKVNFLSGKNGSGKSAVLTALVIGLGGRTSVTNRGSSLKNLILNGQQRAVIEITLSNAGILAFKKSVYGDEIKIIRTISEHSSNYRIVSASGKTVSTKREELDQILMWMNIQVNNPVSVLNQDTARTFLKSADPKDLYRFFMKGTLLEDINALYRVIKDERVPSLEMTLANKKIELEASGKEILELKNKLEKLQELNKHEAERTKKQKELNWAYVIENEKSLELEMRTLKEHESKLSNLRDKVNKRDIVEKQLKEKQATLEEALKGIKERNQLQENEINEAEKKYSEKKEIYLKKQAEVKRLQKKISYEEKNCEELDTEISKVKSRCEEAEAKRIRITEEKKQLVNRLTELNAVKSTVEVHKQQLSDTLNNANQNLMTKQHYMNNIENKIRGKKQYLNTLHKQKNELSVYSNWMPDLVSAMNNAYERGEFDQKPRGPLGAYIKLKEESWGPAVESLIGRRTLCSFCVHSTKDMKTFDKIVRVLKIPAREKPTVAISKFLNEIHDVTKYEVLHPSYSNLLKALIISDSVVTNSLIDQVQIENVLLIPTAEEAYGLMEDERYVPMNCKRALTKKGDVFYPHPNYRSYAGQIMDKARFLQVSPEEAIRMVETELEALNAAYESSAKETEISKKQCKDLQQKISETNQELNKIWKQINASETRITELDNQDDCGNTNFNFLLEDLQFRQLEIKKSHDVLKQMEEDANLALEELNAAEHSLKELENSKISYEDDLTEVQEELANVKQENCKLVNNWKNYKKQLSDEEELIKSIKTRVSKLQDDLSNMIKTAETYSPRFTNSQSVNTLESKLAELKNTIKALENYVGGTSVETSVQFEMEISKFKATLHFIHYITEKLEVMNERLKDIVSKFLKMRKIICMNVKKTFCILLNIRNYKGDLTFDHTKNILAIEVKADNAAKDGSCTVSLSGGERSFSMVSFIMALWTNMDLPFYVLDEFDVFMDPINRSMVMSLLLTHAKDKPRQQFIFLTPNNLGCAATGDYVSMFRMEDPRIEK